MKPMLMVGILGYALAVNGTAWAQSEKVSEEEERAPEVSESTDEDLGIGSEFRFGSYGRVRAATDLRGQSARPVNLVSFGSRIDEESYGELEFQQRFFERSPSSGMETRVVATLSFLDDLFHYTGSFDQSIALRNLYADFGFITGVGRLEIWGGSRMYRGDDIYLLDFWPLDNLNTVGGGARFVREVGPGPLDLRVHAGANRLIDPYQYQTREVPGVPFGTTEVVTLDRQRLVFSGRLEQQFWVKPEGARGFKGILYGESQQLPEGSRILEDGFTEEEVPADRGFLVGGQVGFWEADGFFEGSFGNLFARYGSGLGAYGDLGIPYAVAPDETSSGATDLLLGMSAAVDTPYAGLVLGSYFRNFNTARQSESFEDYWETIVSARVHGYVTDHIHPGFEASYQVRRMQGAYPESESYGRPQIQAPAVTKLSVIQAFSLEPRAFSRPQFRLIYTASLLNDSARMLYRPEDYRRELSTQHYLGVMVEWWFNSSSY